MSWLAFFPRGTMAGLAALRTDSGLEVAECGDELVVRFTDSDLVRELDRCVCRVYREEREGLVEEGDRVPTRRALPEVAWRPLCEWWELEWTVPELPRLQTIPSTGLALVRSAEPRAAVAMQCDLEDLTEWIEGAAVARIDGLQWAASDEGKAWVEGAILPPVPGRRFWHYGSGIFLPSGWQLHPVVAPVQVRRVLAVQGAAKLVAGPEGNWQCIPGECLVPMGRAGVRASLQEIRERGDD